MKTARPVPRLLVDVQTVQGGFFGNRGIRRYAIGLARALAERGVVEALLVNPGRPWIEPMPSELADTGRLTWTTSTSLRELDATGVTGYLMTSPFERTQPVQSAVPPYVVDSGMPFITVLYDLIPEIVPVYPRSLMPAYWARRELVRRADLVLTLSEHVRRDAIGRLGLEPDRVAVVGAGASSFFRPPVPGEEPEAILRRHVPRVDRRFVLCVTGWSAHKNAEGLLVAWSRLPRALRRQRQLVLTCTLPPEARTVWHEHARRLGIGPDELVVTDYVPDDVVRALYQRAELFVLPSRQEGFGLPVLEAACCGAPVITSDATALPEVLEWAPATFPPGDADAMAQVIERALTDLAFVADLHAIAEAAVRRHRWEHVAERTVRALDAMPTPRQPRRRARARVAIVGPAAPSSTTAIGERAASELARDHHVDRFLVPSNGARLCRDHEPVGVYRGRAFGRAFDPASYDVIVYAVDERPERELRELAARHPGVAWFVERAEDPVLTFEMTSGARAVLAVAEAGTLPAAGGPFGRRVPARVVSRAEEVEALVALVQDLVAAVRRPTR